MAFFFLFEGQIIGGNNESIEERSFAYIKKLLLLVNPLHSRQYANYSTVCVCVCVYTYIFTHSSVDGELGFFHAISSLTIVNNAARNTGIHVSFQIIVFVSFRYIPRSGIVGSYGSFTFSF